MKDIVETTDVSESCLTMNISKIATDSESEKETNNDNSFEGENVKPKSEGRDIEKKNDARKSPPLQSLGPGAEIKGKICHPIPSSSKLENLESTDDNAKPIPAGVTGGRLTFFRGLC